MWTCQSFANIASPSRVTLLSLWYGVALFLLYRAFFVPGRRRNPASPMSWVKRILGTWVCICHNYHHLVSLKERVNQLIRHIGSERNQTQATLVEDERFVFCVNSATSLMLIVFPTQIDRQATRALNSTETDDSALSSTQNTIISYLSEDIKSVREVFPEDQSMHMAMWSVLLTFFSPSSPLRYGKRCVSCCQVFSK